MGKQVRSAAAAALFDKTFVFTCGKHVGGTQITADESTLKLQLHSKIHASDQPSSCKRRVCYGVATCRRLLNRVHGFEASLAPHT
jgi:hypothetical protein